MYFMKMHTGDCYIIQGKLQEAQALYTKALMIVEQCFGEGSLGVAVCYGLLAEIAKAEGKAADATDFVEVSIQMLENCGEKPAEVLQYADQLATIYYSEGGIQG